jgi:hypothetical protein
MRSLNYTEDKASLSQPEALRTTEAEAGLVGAGSLHNHAKLFGSGRNLTIQLNFDRLADNIPL